MKKVSQRKRVEEMLLRQGFVSRNYFLQLPYHKILRLGALINLLREDGWNIETKEDKIDCIYTKVSSPYKTVVYKLADGREIVNYK